MTRTFDALVAEEIPIQHASVQMEGGMPGCMTLLDRFLMCYNLSSQAKAFYRYGTAATCSRKYEDFKYCLTLRGMSQEERDQAWVQRRAEWWASRRLGRSSEDVWEARKGVYREPPPATTQTQQ